MSDSIVKVIIPLFVSVLFAATSAAQSATPVAVVDDFLKAWNSHEAKAFDRLFTEDAIWVPVAETRVIGHADVIKQFEQIHTTSAKKTTIIARDIKVQSVRPDVAMILFHYEVTPRKDHRGFDLMSDALPFGRLWYGEPNAVNNAVGYAKFYSRAHDAVIRVYDAAGNVIDTHEHAGDFKEW